jgi:ABC-2 type transport system ATP-binding protein
MLNGQAMIETKGLTRLFKEIRAVDGLDLTIQQGELFGLVGPDGAGKTTTLRMLAGLLDITDGSACVNDLDLISQAEQVKPYIGYMAQEFSLYGELTVLENLSFFSELYDVDPGEIETRTERLLAFAGLTEFKDRRGDQLSGGMKKKLTLACTLIHRPPVLLLDEPTTGVDPISRREFWDILTELHLEGTTIVVSTPYMDEADRCSRVGLMHSGRLISCDTPLRIRAALKGDLIKLITDDWRRAKEVLSELDGVIEIQSYGEALHVRLDSEKKRLKAIKRQLRNSQVQVTELRSVKVRMEEAFISLIEREDRQQISEGKG